VNLAETLSIKLTDH